MKSIFGVILSICFNFVNLAQTFNSYYDNLSETLDTAKLQGSMHQDEINSTDTIKNKYSIGFSGFEFYSEKTGLVVGINGKIKYSFDGINSVNSIIRVGVGFNGYGAVEPGSNDDELFKSYYEISILYCRSLNEILSGLYVGGGVGIIFGKSESENQYFNLCLPIKIGTEIKLTKYLKMDVGINNQINTNSILIGFDLGFLLEF